MSLPTPIAATPDRLASAATLDGLLPPGSTVILRADSDSSLSSLGAWDLGRIGVAGLVAVAYACEGTGIRVDVVDPGWPVPHASVGVAPVACDPTGLLDMSTLAVLDPEFRVVITAAEHVRWRIALGLLR